MKKTNILFINYDIGFNLGYITDFILNKYENVVLCSIYFRDVKHRGKSFINYYKEKHLIESLYIRTKRSNSYLGKLFAHFEYLKIIYKIKKKYSINYVISPNPVFIFFSILLNMKSIYIVGDIMRLDRFSKYRQALGLIIQLLIKFNIKNSYYVWFISNSLYLYFNNIKPNNYLVSTLGIRATKLNLVNKNTKPAVLYIGGFDKVKGVDLIIEVANNMKNIEFVLIGNAELKSKKVIDNIIIYPPVIDNNELEEILSNRNYIGIAPYIEEGLSSSYLGDPTKIKQYLSYCFPVITTNYVEFGKELSNYNAGLSIEYSKHDLEKAINLVYDSYSFYQNNVKILLKKYNFIDFYRDIFDKIIV